MTSVAVAVEQCRARGLTVEQTAVLLGIHPRKVIERWRAMDAVNAEDEPRMLGRPA